MAKIEVWVPDDEPGVDQLFDWLRSFLSDDCGFGEFEVRSLRD